MIRQPRLLDANFSEVRRLNPSSLSVTANLTPLSTATMTIVQGDEAIPMRAWVEIFGKEGSLGLYRVQSVSKAYGDKQTVQMEQALCTLDDGMIILGTDSDGSRLTEVSGTMQEVLATLLGYQPVQMWQLGTVALQDGKTYTATADRSSVLEAVLDVVKKAYGYYLQCDFSTIPWTMHLLKLPENVTSECRMTRNTESVTIAYDDTDLCTRVHAVQLPNGYMDADTVSTWGIVGKALNADDDADATLVQQAAESYLQEYKNPTLTITVSALRLAELTGETLDSFTLGARCRIALPDFGTVLDENIITMTYQDLLKQPEKVQLTLSKPSRDSSTLQAKTKQEAKSAGRSGRKASSKAASVDNKFEVQREYIRLLATKTDENTNTINSVELVLNGADGTGGLVAQVSNDHKTLSEASVKLDAVEATLDLKVEKAGVISAINMTTEDITIQAKKINLSGYVTATQLEATTAKIDNLTSGITEASILQANVFKANRATIPIINARRVVWKKVTINNEELYLLQGYTQA